MTTTRPPTIYDVALRAGVAPSTVSRALARPGRVSAATAERVRRAAAEIGYRRSTFAPALLQVPTKLLAIIVPDITNPVFHEVVRGAQAAADEHGYTLVLLDAQESDVRERDAAQQFLSSVEGMILTSPRSSDSTIHGIAKQRPVVVLNRSVRGLPGVVTDNARGSRKAAEHLGGLGHTSVTYLAGPESSWADGMRWRGLQEAGVDLDMTVRRVGPNEPTVAGGEQAARQWAQHPTSAVLGFNDVMAIGFIRGLRTMGLYVPRDVSVVGFDNSRTGSLTTPALTSVATPLRAQGATAVNNLVAIVHGARSSQETSVMPVKLVVRASSAARGNRR
ncbi:MAG: LacI family DNA-binding transcriptional regulator [Cellulomonadaceae bacterium]